MDSLIIQFRHNLISATLCILAMLVAVPVAEAAPSPTLSGAEAVQWQEDLDYLVENLAKLHKDAFHGISEGEFNRQAAELREAIPTMNVDQVIAGLAQQVAMIGDSHTSLNIFSTGVQFYPFQLQYFSDGLYVLMAHPGQAAAVGCRPVAINGVPLKDVESAVRSAFHFSNDSGARAQLPNLLIIGGLLHGLDITDDPQSAVWTFAAKDGKTFDLEVNAFTPSAISGWPQAFDPATPVPMYRQQRSNPYYYMWNPDRALLFFQYNGCVERDDLSFRDFSDMLVEAIDQYAYQKFVIDLRFNGGGNSGIADPLIDLLAADERVNKDGVLFVIIGRSTFSSAVLNALSLQQKTDAIFVGEPSGGSPNHFGELQQLTLANSGISISYSTKYFQWVDGDADAIYPDIEIGLSFADYLAGNDPALEKILVY